MQCTPSAFSVLLLLLHVFVSVAIVFVKYLYEEKDIERSIALFFLVSL